MKLMTDTVWHQSPAEEVIESLGVNLKTGLSAEEVARRLVIFPCPHVEQTQIRVLFAQCAEFLRREENLRVLLVARLDVLDHPRHIGGGVAAAAEKDGHPGRAA